MVKLKDTGLTTVVLVVALVCILNASGAWSQLDPGMILNINCGSSVDVVDPITNLTWYADDKYITTGATSSNVPTFSSWYPQLKTLRFFNDTRLPKYCYELPVLSTYTYMLRAEFQYGRYDNGNAEPSFQMTIDGLVVDHVTTSRTTAYFFEFMYTAYGNTTFVCFLRDYTRANPFISTLSLRRVRVYPAMSHLLKNRRRIAKTRGRLNFGGTSGTRYPIDTYDRYWTQVNETGESIFTSTTSLQGLSSSRPLVYLGGNPDYVQVPTTVLQSALTSSGSMTLSLDRSLGSSMGDTGFLILHFVELDPAVNETSRVFTVSLSSGGQIVVNPLNQSRGTNAPMLWSFDEIAFKSTSVETVTFAPDPSSVYGPMINAAEFFEYIQGLAPAKTRNEDAVAIDSIKSSLKLQEWNGDPCVPVPHAWMMCSTVNSPDISPAIESVNLSNYKLAGTIPPAFATLGALTTLILSGNNLAGDLPDLRRLTHLERLHLQDNNLTGPLPAWLGDLENLSELFVQNNNFVGPIPRALNRSTLKFVYTPGNPLLGLEQGPGKTSIWVIVGPVLGGGVAVIAVVIIAIFCCCKKRRSTDNTSATNVDKAVGVDGAVPNAPNARAFTISEISKATENFSKEIGKGGFGIVYYGKLPNGVEVAVKVLASASTQGATEFSNEVNVLSRVHHKNLVSLLGFCNEHKKQMLIYEYLSEGSLRDRLNGTRHSGEFDFKSRVNVALNAAQGLEYLHNSCSPSIVHRDIKSSNILLTNTKDVAKVADFGLSRLAPEEEAGSMTFIKGTRGYIDPEYVSTHYLTSKSDVYSFGVVLLELLTGRQPLPSGSRSQADFAWTICDWVRNTLHSSNDVSKLLDPVLSTSIYDKEAVWKMTEIAMMCVEPKSIHRPTMIEVVNELRGTLTIEEAKPSKTSHHHQQHSRKSSSFEFNSTSLSLSDPHWPTPR